MENEKLDETGFEFLGDDGRVYLCRMIQDDGWFCYKVGDEWVTLTKVGQTGIWAAKEREIDPAKRIGHVHVPDETNPNYSKTFYRPIGWSIIGTPKIQKGAVEKYWQGLKEINSDLPHRAKSHHELDMEFVKQSSGIPQTKSIMTEFPSYIDSVMFDFYKKVIDKKEELIKQALINNDIDPTDLNYLGQHLDMVIIEGDPFEHYYFDYGKPTGVRLISFKKLWSNSPTHPDNLDNLFKISIDIQYY